MSLQQAPPAHLNATYIGNALEKALGFPIKIIDLQLELATVEGENFCSNIYRTEVKYEAQNGQVKTLALIIKDMIMEVADIGSSELLMYEQVLPPMQNILKLALSESTKTKLFPKCFLSERGEHEVYILENLNALGYKRPNRLMGLNEAESFVVFEKLAMYHAASMMYLEKFPKEAENIPVSHFAHDSTDGLAEVIVFGGIKRAITVVEQWPDYEHIAEKMRKSLTYFDARMKQQVDAKKSQCAVITHGDLWINNMLISYDDEGTPTDVVFVDFQNCYVSSPGIDINYVLYTSLPLDVFQRKRYELLRHYYTTLKTTLKASGAKSIPRWEQILAEVHNCEFMGYYTAVCEMPYAWMSAETAKGFTNKTFSDREAVAKKQVALYDEPCVQEFLKYALDRFDEMKLFEFELT